MPFRKKKQSRAMGGTDLTRLKERAASCMARGEWKNALRALLIAQEHMPRDTYIARKIGDVYQRMGKVKKAIEAYKNAAKLYAANGFLYKAISVNKIVLTLNPEDQEVSDALKALYSQKQSQRIFDAEIDSSVEMTSSAEAVGVYLDRVSKETLLWIPLLSELQEEELNRVLESMVRKKKRLNVIKQVNFSYRGEARRAYSRDLSAGGVFLRTRDVVPESTELELSLHLYPDREPLMLIGTVVRAMTDGGQRGFGVGFQQDGQEQALEDVKAFVLATMEEEALGRLKINPRDLNSLYDLAEIARERNDLLRTEEYLRKITQIKSPSVAHGFLAEVILHRALETGDKALYREATELFDVALKLGDSDGLGNAQMTLKSRINTLKNSHPQAPFVPEQDEDLVSIMVEQDQPGDLSTPEEDLEPQVDALAEREKELDAREEELDQREARLKKLEEELEERSQSLEIQREHLIKEADRLDALEASIQERDKEES